MGWVAGRRHVARENYGEEFSRTKLMAKTDIIWKCLAEDRDIVLTLNVFCHVVGVPFSAYTIGRCDPSSCLPAVFSRDYEGFRRIGGVVVVYSSINPSNRLVALPPYTPQLVSYPFLSHTSVARLLVLIQLGSASSYVILAWLVCLLVLTLHGPSLSELSRFVASRYLKSRRGL